MSTRTKIVTKDGGIKTAIFFDGDWLYSDTKQIKRKIDYSIFFSSLIKKFGVNTEINYYGAINSADKKQVRFYALLKKIGYKIYCTELIKREGVFISKGLEVKLAVDAMQRLASFKKFVLISGDGDFSPLLEKITYNHIEVVVVSLPFTTGYQLRKINGVNFLNLALFISEGKVKAFKPLKRVAVERFEDQNYIREGDSFDSYIKFRDMVESAKDRIVIIDSYIDDQILLMIQPIKHKINKSIITNTKKITPPDFFVQVKKLKNDGHLLDIYDSKNFHDRFIYIDDNWWHSGHSFKNLGEKNSLFSKVNQNNAQKLDDEVSAIINKK
jgi:uncharacterized LabA/DUF88 family protein